MGVWSKECHLTFGIAAIGAVRVGLDEFPDREAIRGYFWGDASVFSHGLVSFGLKLPGKNGDYSRIARVSRNASIPKRPYSRPTPEYLNPPQGACGSSVMPVITTRPVRNWEGTRRAPDRAGPSTAAWRPYLESLAIRIASSSES